MTLHERLSDLRLEVNSYRLEPLALKVGTGWNRRTTVVHLEGTGQEGLGEDITYDADNQVTFQERGADLPLAGVFSLDRFSRQLGEVPLPPPPPGEPGAGNYRRWAFESAALDLALRQAGASLAEALDRTPMPVRFALSPGLGTPPTATCVHQWLVVDSAHSFKLDLSPGWTDDLAADLAATGRVVVADLKGHYHGDFTGAPVDPTLYRVVAEGLPEAILEDPALTPETSPILAPHHGRISWDAPIHSVRDIEALDRQPAWMNIKPSRFGRLAELCAAYEHCAARGIRMYGGGQFELGPGRGQNQYLAALLHADGPNDLAPVVFHDATPGDRGLPTSPLTPSPSATGFRWGQGA